MGSRPIVSKGGHASPHSMPRSSRQECPSIISLAGRHGPFLQGSESDAKWPKARPGRLDFRSGNAAKVTGARCYPTNSQIELVVMTTGDAHA